VKKYIIVDCIYCIVMPLIVASSGLLGLKLTFKPFILMFWGRRSDKTLVSFKSVFPAFVVYGLSLF
jgi:hypothetical protein